MNNADYKAFVSSVEDVFASLYMLDVGSMSPDQRAAHQEALNTAYSAMLSAQNAELKALTEKAMQQLDDLASATAKMQDQLAGLKKTAQVLKIVDAGLGILSSIVKLLG